MYVYPCSHMHAHTHARTHNAINFGRFFHLFRCELLVYPTGENNNILLYSRCSVYSNSTYNNKFKENNILHCSFRKNTRFTQHCNIERRILTHLTLSVGISRCHFFDYASP